MFSIFSPDLNYGQNRLPLYTGDSKTQAHSIAFGRHFMLKFQVESSQKCFSLEHEFTVSETFLMEDGSEIKVLLSRRHAHIDIQTGFPHIEGHGFQTHLVEGHVLLYLSYRE